jgi:hypothetical protein
MTFAAVASGTRWARSLVWVLALSAVAHAQTATTREATPTEVQAFLRQQNKRVLTFAGYSGAGYQDPAAMLRQAGQILDEFEPAKRPSSTSGPRRTASVRSTSWRSVGGS